MMNTIRLIALDMDGTTLRSDHKPSTHTISILTRAVREGIAIVPATGRQLDILPPEIASVPGIDYAITSNGAAVFNLNTGETLCSECIPMPLFSQAIQFVRQYNVYYDLYIHGKAYTTKTLFAKLSPEIQERYLSIIDRRVNFVDDLDAFLLQSGFEAEKINIPFLPGSIIPKLWKEIEQVEQLVLCASGFDNIEVNYKNATKGHALKTLAQSLNIAPEHIMAIGDSGNDIEMLKFAAVPIAMKNAVGDVKDIASFITKSNDEDGVAYAIETLIFEH